MVVALICLSIYTTLQLNSRSGTVVMAASLFVSIMFRLFLAPSRKPFLRAHTMSFVAFLVSIPVFLQWKYGIFDTIIAIYQVTNLYEDSSFAIRILAYEYLGNELLNSTYLPNFLGSPAGYSGFWRVSRGMFNPHFSLLDIYIKGGMVYLCVYIYLLASSILRCLRGALEGKDVRQKAVFAGFLAYVVGFLPLMVTLSIEDTKMPWGIIGCVLGFTAHTRISVARVKRRARTIEVEDVAQCPG